MLPQTVTESQKKLDEKGTYTDKDDVAEYIYEYGTCSIKSEMRKLMIMQII